MNNREKSLTGYLIGINLLHVVLCFAVMMLRRYEFYEALRLKWAALILTVMLWYIFSYITALGSYMSKKSVAVGFALLSVLPITILTGISFGLSFIREAGWLKFFFIGSSVNYYFRPMAGLLRFLPASAYLFYAVCIAVMAVLSMLGALSGMEASRKKVRGRKVTSVKKKSGKEVPRIDENQVEEAAVVDDEAPRAAKAPRRLSAKDREKLIEESDEELNAEIERLRKKLEENQAKRKDE